MKIEKRWLAAESDSTHAEKLAEQLGVSPLIARLLINRGLTDAVAARRFLEPDRLGFYDPYLMKDMDKAVTRIRQAIDQQERIMVYGDYDADGATSTSLMYLALAQQGADVEYYIPDRFEEGYGLNGPALQQAKENGFQLVITVDNGIAAVEEVRLANELGLDLIVTDHHTPPEILPDAYAILNPKQPGCPYPDKMLAGVGVAFKLAQALFGRLPEEYLDLAVIGTVADLAPLVDENRLFAVYGLERINQSPRVGIKALIDVSGLTDKRITAGHIGFSFGPRINAAGRLDSAANAVELLITEEEGRARSLAYFLDKRNQERQEISAQIFEEAVAEVQAHPEWLESRVLVVAKENWNAGVIGIVASRLVEQYYRPVLMISLQAGEGKGSGRSIDGFHLYNAMYQCRDLFDHFGGHKMAAGFSLGEERIGELRDRLNQIAEAVLTPDDLRPKVNVDAEVDLLEVDTDLVASIEKLAPFGFGNPSPKLQLTGLEVERCRAVGQDGAHLQLTVGLGAARLTGIAFRRGEEAALIHRWPRLDLVGGLTINEWNGNRTVQLVIDDWRPNQAQVIDCRHVKDKQTWLNEQAGTKDLTVVCFHKESVAETRRALEQYPWQEPHQQSVLLADGKGVLQPVYTSGKQNGLLSGESDRPLPPVTDFPLSGHIVFYDLPQTLDQYRNVVDLIGGTYCLYLLHGQSDRKWLEQRIRQHLPDRQMFARIYKILQESGACTDEELRRRLQPAYHAAADFVLSVFVELGFAVQEGNTYYVNKESPKRSLEESTLYRERKAGVQSYVDVMRELLDASSDQTTANLMVLLASPQKRSLQA
ncbi:single-stranded-DNA-specific exonuclease RecJ [Effusibacillus dendaii]|uniref:Single-stranded-DNA-specific exonuclease RecJ n=1 Tax=Effusibacillus dendaii TaxID=2743772 RepID=A0A7I8DGX8_9BACL|nr:single-stranded-DNA-specific exonuclease RecJ [Effusibacillus dendaii]BCJ88136.1 single-stranded-DNA-specific exonuclease RecJ [Effusibacillus dendaii]